MVIPCTKTASPSLAMLYQIEPLGLSVPFSFTFVPFSIALAEYLLFSVSLHLEAEPMNAGCFAV